MKKWLEKFWPDSLYGQLLLAMLMGAAVLQGINLYAVCFIQHSFNVEVHKVRYDYNSSIFLALQNMEPNQRELFLNGLEKSQAALSQPFQFIIARQAPLWQTDDTALANEAVGIMTTALKAGAADLYSPIRARVMQKSDADASRPFYRNSRFPLMQMIIQMDEDSWLKITQPLWISNASVVWMQRLFILLESILFSLVIILLIRRATRPLNRLARAADKFGRNPEVMQPLAECGSREVREASQSFNRMRERICNNINERSRMLSAMAHDLRSPLARIQVRLEKIKPDELRDQFAANINEIQSIIQQGIELAKSLNTSEKPTPLDLAAFIQSLVDDLDDQGLNVRLSGLPPAINTPVLVTARLTCLKRCLENILENALKYGQKAEITVLRKPDEVLIEVADQGPGIPEEFLEKVFEPYYRLERSRNRALGGTGLGLSIARNMALLNNGEITLRNRPEGGWWSAWFCRP